MKFVIKVIPFFLLLLLAFQSTALGERKLSPRDIAVNINGSFIHTDSNPYVEKRRILVPLRTLSSLGLTYTWDSKSHTAVITNEAKDEVKVTADQSTAYKNGKAIKLDVPAINKNGRIMVPIRFVSEAFDYFVTYEKTRVILFINSKDYNPDKSLIGSDDLQKARLAAISLPITFSFTPTVGAERNAVTTFYRYSFPRGDASRYVYNNGLAMTVVEIQDGIARAVWQFEIGMKTQFTNQAGQQPSYSFNELLDVQFEHSMSGTNTATFFTKGFGGGADHPQEQFTYITKFYGDIIQTIPNQGKNIKLTN
ncbi:MAG: copper amine oxidase N-terminal domain-containing protein [Bacillota bacterium]